MKQIVQNLNNGETLLVETPAPIVKEGHILIRSVNSLVSVGTEAMLVAFGKAGWWSKAKQQPEKVQQVLQKIKTDGLLPTIEAVKAKLNTPIPLGYANAGIVLEVGDKVQGFQKGDRVVSNGSHAELVLVPQNLVSHIPEGVSFEEAAFAVPAAIALEGIRNVAPSFGETIVVIGLGLIGQLAVQLLKANGCNVIGIDNDATKCALAHEVGIETIHTAELKNPAQVVIQHNHHHEVDAVLITASAQNDTLIHDAAQMCRKRGRIVLTGVVNMHLQRNDFYEKEISFKVSCSYGPGRYDYDYEKNSNDYPLAFVRWTAKRNFDAVLQALLNKSLSVRYLIQKKLDIEAFAEAYSSQNLQQKKICLFQYNTSETPQRHLVFNHNIKAAPNAFSTALIGAGAYVNKVLLPQLKNAKAHTQIICSAQGLSASVLAQKYNIPEVCSDTNVVFNHQLINNVIIATPHQLHAAQCIAAIKAQKHVYVEKPLCISYDELVQIKEAYHASNVLLHVGFNRRFAPIAQKVKRLIDPKISLNIIITVNVGTIAKNHWLQDAAHQGSRIIGEIGHFIDLVAFFTSSSVKALCANSRDNTHEEASVLLKMENGSQACINYFCNGNPAYDKERIEIHSAGCTLIIENWRKLKTYGFSNVSPIAFQQDKGQVDQIKLWKNAVEKEHTPLIDFNSIYNTSWATIAVHESLNSQDWVYFH